MRRKISEGKIYPIKSKVDGPRIYQYEVIFDLNRLKVEIKDFLVFLNVPDTENFFRLEKRSGDPLS